MKTRSALWSLLSLVLMLLVAACSQGADTTATDVVEIDVAELSQNADGYTDITVQQLAAMLPDKDLTMVNVHIPFEGDIPQTDLSIPYNEIADHLDQLADKDAPIVLYCRSGSMSTQAAKRLAELGYSNVMEVDGGFRAWKAAGYSMAGE
jgi:rhodanese-related sulfurtransferase